MMMGQQRLRRDPASLEIRVRWEFFGCIDVVGGQRHGRFLNLFSLLSSAYAGGPVP
jgi:hypothetical protein